MTGFLEGYIQTYVRVTSKVLLVVAVMFAIGFVKGEVAIAKDAPANSSNTATSWLNHPVTVMAESTKLPIETYWMHICSGGLRHQIFSRDDDTWHVACVYGNDYTLRLARYYQEGRGYVYAVSFPMESNYYRVDGLCLGSEQCSYAPATDALMGASYISRYVNSVSLYEGFSKHLIRRQDAAVETKSYIFEPQDEPFQLKLYGRPAAAESSAFSSNGEWAIIELRSYGFVVVNTKTKATHRVVAPGIEYGLGNDVTTELAVSNDGRHVAIVGNHLSISVYEVTDACGDTIDDSTNVHFRGDVMLCQSVYLDAQRLIPNFLAAHFPEFSPNTNSLTVAVDDADGRTRGTVTLGFAGSSVVDRLAYLALGDSYTSGQGETKDTNYLPGTNSPPNLCHVGINAYPFLLARAWSVRGENIACSGARTIDVAGDGLYLGQWGSGVLSENEAESPRSAAAVRDFLPGVVRQGDFVETYMPGLVSLSVGGNDSGVMVKPKACLGLGTCDWAKNPYARQAALREVDSTTGKVRGVIADVQNRSPGSRVAVVGYPIPIKADGDCGILLNGMLNQSEREFMVESIDHLNAALRRAAEATDVLYIDVSDALAGHRLCEDDQLAMNGIRLGDDIAPIDSIPGFKVIGSETFHPTPFGHWLVAQAILAQHPSYEGVIGQESTQANVPNTMSAGATLSRSQQSSAEPNRDELWSGSDTPESIRWSGIDVAELRTGGATTLALPTKIAALREGVATLSDLGSGVDTTAERPEDGRVILHVAVSSTAQPSFGTLYVDGFAESGDSVRVYVPAQIVTPAPRPLETGSVNVNQAAPVLASEINTVEVAAVEQNSMQASLPQGLVLGAHSSAVAALPYIHSSKNTPYALWRDKNLQKIAACILVALALCVGLYGIYRTMGSGRT